MAGVGQPPTPATIQSLQSALALYRGDFLEGFYGRDAPDFEQWVLVQRANYREAVIKWPDLIDCLTNDYGKARLI